ncbi:MAG: hypothetical protein HOF43_02695 [Chloroflexi bacterium]|nr:hypothetical protein [Chloroflexota bacterium]
MKLSILSVVTTTLLIALAACGGDDTSSTPTPVVEPTPVEVSNDPTVVLPAISGAMASAGSWQIQAQLTVEDGSGDTRQSLTTVINGARSGPGSNIVLTSSSAITGSITGSTSSENRIVASTRYRRDPNSGDWSVSNASDATPGLTIDAAAVDQIEASSAEITIENFEGEQVYHVTGSIPGVDAAAKVEVFAGVNDNLVRMIRLEGTALPANFGGLLAISDTPLPQVVEARYLEYGRQISVHVPPGADQAENAEVQTYLSTINPFTMDLPALLSASPRTELGGEAYAGGGGEALFVIEEHLDVETTYVGDLEGVEPSPQSYARRFEIELENSDIYSIVSNEPFTTDSGLEAHLIQFTEADGAINWLHLSYLHGEDFGFGASYGGFHARFEEIEDDILSTFKSFDIVE